MLYSMKAGGFDNHRIKFHLMFDNIGQIRIKIRTNRFRSVKFKLPSETNRL